MRLIIQSLLVITIVGALSSASASPVNGAGSTNTALLGFDFL